MLLFLSCLAFFSCSLASISYSTEEVGAWACTSDFIGDLGPVVVDDVGEVPVEKDAYSWTQIVLRHRAPVARFLLHTTGTRSVCDWSCSNGTLHDKRYWPHFLAGYDKYSKRHRILQYLPLSTGCAAAGAVNNMGTIQVEVVGAAGKPFTSASYRDEYNHTLEVIRALYKRVTDLCPAIPNALHPAVTFYAEEDADSFNAKSRMSPEVFDAVRGLVGHQHAYRNTHWDPGTIDATLLVSDSCAATESHGGVDGDYCDGGSLLVSCSGGLRQSAEFCALGRCEADAQARTASCVESLSVNITDATTSVLGAQSAARACGAGYDDALICTGDSSAVVCDVQRRVFQWSAVCANGCQGACVYDDVPVASWESGAVRYACRAFGAAAVECGSGQFCPTQTATRATLVIWTMGVLADLIGSSNVKSEMSDRLGAAHSLTLSQLKALDDEAWLQALQILPSNASTTPSPFDSVQHGLMATVVEGVVDVVGQYVGDASRRRKRSSSTTPLACKYGTIDGYCVGADDCAALDGWYSSHSTCRASGEKCCMPTTTCDYTTTGAQDGVCIEKSACEQRGGTPIGMRCMSGTASTKCCNVLSSTSPSQGVTDVNASSLAYDSTKIMAALDKRILNKCTPFHFCPAIELTRAQLILILRNVAVYARQQWPLLTAAPYKAITQVYQDDTCTDTDVCTQSSSSSYAACADDGATVVECVGSSIVDASYCPGGCVDGVCPPFCLGLDDGTYCLSSYVVVECRAQLEVDRAVCLHGCETASGVEWDRAAGTCSSSSSHSIPDEEPTFGAEDFASIGSYPFAFRTSGGGDNDGDDDDNRILGLSSTVFFVIIGSAALLLCAGCLCLLFIMFIIARKRNRGAKGNNLRRGASFSSANSSRRGSFRTSPESNSHSRRQTHSTPTPYVRRSSTRGMLRK